jgi:hypothetical protein
VSWLLVLHTDFHCHALGWKTYELGFHSQHGHQIFVFSNVFRPTVWSTQLQIQWILWARPMG